MEQLLSARVHETVRGDALCSCKWTGRDSSECAVGSVALSAASKWTDNADCASFAAASLESMNEELLKKC